MNILITGAASGIGLNTGLKLAKLGYHVFLTTEDDKQLEVLREKVVDFPNIGTFRLNVKNKEDVELLKKFNVDVLISNAALGLGGSILEADMKKVRDVYEVNVFSNFELIRIVLNNMLNKNSGKIIIISSMIANIPVPFMGIYGSTKASISMLGQCLKKEIKLINKNVQITLIEPGIYKTGFNKVMLDNKYDNENSRFKKFDESIRNFENELLKYVGTNNLNSVSDKIIDIIEKDKLKSIYRTPLVQSILIKLYIKYIKK